MAVWIIIHLNIIKAHLNIDWHGQVYNEHMSRLWWI